MPRPYNVPMVLTILGVVALGVGYLFTHFGQDSARDRAATVLLAASVAGLAAYVTVAHHFALLALSIASLVVLAFLWFAPGRPRPGRDVPPAA